MYKRFWIVEVQTCKVCPVAKLKAVLYQDLAVLHKIWEGAEGGTDKEIPSAARVIVHQETSGPDQPITD
jgi:hypothetical protein